MNRQRTRWLSFLLAIIMVLAMLPPVPAFATERLDTNGFTDLMHIICYGQSFSVGADAPGYADPIVEGTYVLGSITGSTAGDKLLPLQMTSGAQHPIVTAVNSLSQMLNVDGIDTGIIAGSYGSGGRTIAQLMSAERQAQIKEEEGYTYDIQSSGRYTVFQNSVAAVADYARGTGQSVSCPAIVFLQGETDQNTDAQLGYPENPVRAGYGAGGDKEKYKQYMARLKEDMQREVMEAYGQTEKPLFLIYQVSGTYVRTPYSSINMAQLEFAQENDDVILVQTPYFTPHYTNSHHLTVNGYRWLGEYIGQSIYTALTKQEKTWPLLPQEFMVEDERTLRITVSGAVNGLTIDTWTVEDATNGGNKYGFYLEMDGTMVVPETVTVDGNDIVLTLPDSTVSFDYAQSIYVFYGGQKAKGTGNIRDNSEKTGFYSYLDDSADTGSGNNQGVSHSALDENGASLIGQPYPLYNWLASFCYEIPGAKQKEGSTYRWEMQENELVSVTDEQTLVNPLTLLQGSVENGILKNVQYEMEKTVALYHDRPWFIEWKAAGNGSHYGGGMLLAAPDGSGSKAGALYTPADSRGLVAWNVSSAGRNYGIKLGTEGIDTREEHTYRIENRIADDGTNTVWLIVDGTEMGNMNTSFSTSNGSQNDDVTNWANGADIYLRYMGKPTSFLLNNMKLSWLTISEGDHEHRYQASVTAPTCTEQGYTTYTCGCGDRYVDSYVEATGHSYADGFCTICGAEEKVEPMFMQYDDHLDVTGKTVEILDAGDSIVRAEGNYLVAAGIGTARVKIDDTTYEITVGKAKLNLVMVIGQSNSGNHFPNATSKVTCPPGTAYYWKYAATEPEDYTQPSMGFHAPLLAELYAQSVAAGDPVKNVLLWEEGYTSKNGQSMTAWAVEKDGAINTDGTNGAAEMIRDCLAYYEQHSDKYEIVNKLVFCNHGTTDHAMDPQRYIRLFTAMWERLKAEGMEYLAFLRVRGAHSLNTPENADTYYNAASSAQFEMVRNREDMFMATTLTEAWTGPVNTAHSIDICNYITVMETYGQAAEYSDSYGNKASYADGILTTTMKELYGSNNKVHYGIFGYGLIGADAAYNMYAALNGNRAATVTQTDSSGLKSAEHISSMGSMQTLNIEDLAYNLSFYPTCGSPKGTMHIIVTAEDMDITEKVVSSETSTFGTINTEALRGYVHPVITVSYTYGGKTESVTYTLEFDHPCNSGHGYESVVTPPTCTEQGYTTYTCHCGNSYVNNYVEALGHRYGEWTVTIAPTCTETGVERRDCENCDHNETRSIAASGHDYESVVTPPTCTERGYTTHTCHCGYSYVDSYVDALGHRYGEWKVTTAPTCTETGQERRDCENCDRYESRPVAATGHDYESVVTLPTCTEQGYTTHTCHCGSSFVDSYVEATGHRYGEWKVTTAATCTAAGEERRDCESCDHYETRPVAATGHDYESVVTSPTCSEQGYTTHTCHCGANFVDSYVEATGHSWGDWKVVKEPTNDETGLQQRTCVHCGETEQQEIPKLEVSYGDVNSDGRINTLDLIILRQYLAGWDVELDTAAADINGNGTVNTLDLILLRKYLNGADITLGPQET